MNSNEKSVKNLDVMVFFLKISKIMLQHLSLIKLGCDNVLHILKFEI